MDNMGHFSQAQWASWPYHGAPYPSGYAQHAQLPSYTTYLPESMEIYTAHQRHLVHHPMSRATESKPRLSKEEVEILEAEFQKNHKPNSSTKKALAESMRVDNARINNWFQNRRAREKKERNIREYAAKQKMEKDKGPSEIGNDPNNDRHKDMVVSSAPFPDVRRASKASTESSSLATPGYESESTDAGQGDDLAIYSSPDDSLDKPLALDEMCNIEEELVSDGSSGIFSPNQRAQSDELSLSNPGSLVSLGEKPFFGQYPQLVIPNDEEDQVTPSFQQCFSEDSSVQETEVQCQQNGYSMGMMPHPVSISPEVALKSPPSIDIASRRNRRPPHLAINASRSYSSGFPRTGLDMGRRADTCGPMRRVASATGTGRVSKSSSTPRSPFFDRNTEALFQLNRSPGFVANPGSVAPPTPNTPVVVDQTSVGEITPSYTLSIDEKYSSTLALQDPTLRTPPTTPGMMENLFNMASVYGVSASDEPLITPSIGNFPSDFEVLGMANNVPNYITHGCSSQPQTPSYPPQMGPSYFGYPGGNAEYNWCDAPMSASSSPGQNQRHVQFMNMTPSSFTHIEK